MKSLSTRLNIIIAVGFIAVILIIILKPENDLIRYSLFVLAGLMQMVWYWQLNDAAMIILDRKRPDRIIPLLLLFNFISFCLHFYYKSMLNEWSYLDFYRDLLMVTRLSGFVLIMIVTCILTVRIKKIVPERSIWFMFVELSSIILSTNLVELIEEKLEKTR